MKYYKICRVHCRCCGDILEYINRTKNDSGSMICCSCRKVWLDPAAVMYRILGDPEDYQDCSKEWIE